MSLLDGLIKSVLGGDENGGKSVNLGQFQAIWEWIQDQGGIEVLLNKFQQGGLGEILSSWIGTGQNAAIGRSEIQSAFSSSDLQSLAGKLGTDTQQASDLLAQLLPQFVDGISPQGEVKADIPASSSELGSFVDNIFKR